MPSVCFYFQVHQPFRLRKYTVFDIGKNSSYFDEQKNEQILLKVAKKCYLPTNRLMLNLINNTDGRFKVSYSMTGIILEQFEKYCPEVIESFKQLVKTKKVEILSETYHHSLAYLYSKEEFKEQIFLHKKKIKELFGFSPKIFRNTELIYDNALAKFIEKLGYEGIIAEGADHILGWRSPNFIYRPKDCNKIKLLLKNYKLSDDIAFRFSERSWAEWPLTAEKYASWIAATNGDVVNLFMDYETFGEHQWSDTGIFNFLKQLPFELFNYKNINFKLPSELLELKDVAELDIPYTISWADVERDLSAWLGNKMQQSAIKELYMIEKEVKQTGNKGLIDAWRKAQISDHFYYMCTKWFADGDVHRYFNPYDSPYDSFIAFMNILNDLIIRVKRESIKNKFTHSYSSVSEVQNEVI